MFKKENEIWLYLLGVLIMFGILGLATRDYMLPIFYTREKNLVVQQVESGGRPDLTIDTTLDYGAILSTNYGTIEIDLFENSAPVNVNNFIYLANRTYYNGTKFHRLVPDFLLQGGDRRSIDNNPENDGKGYPGYLIEDEINIESLNLSEERQKELSKYDTSDTLQSANLTKYSIAMANSGRDTNGSQFFIVLADSDNSALQEMNGKFTVIGQITSGFVTLNTINATPVDNTKLNTPRPQDEIVLNSVEIFLR